MHFPQHLWPIFFAEKGDVLQTEYVVNPSHGQHAFLFKHLPTPPCQKVIPSLDAALVGEQPLRPKLSCIQGPLSFHFAKSLFSPYSSPCYLLYLKQYCPPSLELIPAHFVLFFFLWVGGYPTLTQHVWPARISTLFPEFICPFRWDIHLRLAMSSIATPGPLFSPFHGFVSPLLFPAKLPLPYGVFSFFKDLRRLPLKNAPFLT